jgi:Fe-S cluster assembly ATPase SufC
MASVGKIKVMLKDINLQIKSGEMCAIMGPTGSGKSTLLELIANRKIAGFWCGEVMINKKPRPDWFQQICACKFMTLKPDLILTIVSRRHARRHPHANSDS